MPRFRVLAINIALCSTLIACQSINTDKLAHQSSSDINDEQNLSDKVVGADQLTEFGPDKHCSIEEFSTDGFELTGTTDLWERIRKGFELHEVNHPRVETYLEWYVKHPQYLQRVGERGNPYLHHITSRLEEENLPLELALLPIVESAFDPFAYSHGRAAGIWQFIPGTGKAYGLDQNWWYDGRRDIIASTEAAIRYLKYLNKFFDGNWLHALAAYNSGEGTVRRSKRKNHRAGKPTDYWSLRLPKETAAYVPQLLALSKIVADPDKYGVTLYPIENKPVFEVVKVGTQIDLSQAADLAGISIDRLYKLNPGYNRWATTPNGNNQLVIPIEKVDIFTERLSQLSPQERIGWERYKIASGDSLIKIAKKFNTDVSTLKSVNNIRNNTIRAGDALMIPVAKQPLNQYTHSQAQRTTRKQSSSPSNKSQKVIYTVKAGDSFWTIAKRYSVKVRTLASWNAMAPTDPLQINQKLVVWTRAKVSNNNSNLAFNHNSDTIRKIHYRVRKGDSLARIAQKFNLTVQKIKGWNQVAHNKYLQPGDKLTLFVNVTNLQ